MSADALFNLIQRVVRQELASQRSSLLGVVTEIFAHEAEDDEHNYEVNLRLKHEDLELRKVPVAVPHIGIAAPPRVGDLVLVHFINGDLNQPVIGGRFYHADERPPLHRSDDILFEQRIPDGKLNHLRFAPDGAIYIQRDVTKPEDNSEALAGIKLDPDGNIEIKSGELTITLTIDDKIEILADGKPVNITCDTLTIDGKLSVTGDSALQGSLVVGATSGPKTTIDGNEISGSPV